MAFLAHHEDAQVKTLWFFKRALYMSDYMRAWARLGYTCRMLSGAEMVDAYTKGEPCDGVVTSFLHPEKCELVERMGVPLIWMVWDQFYIDMGLWNTEQQESAKVIGLPMIMPALQPKCKRLYAFACGPELVKRLYGDHVEHMLFGVDADRFRPMGLPKVYPYGFVGTSLIGNELDGAAILEKLGEKSPFDLNRITDHATRETWRIMLDIRRTSVERVEVCQKMGAHVWGDGWDGVTGIQHHRQADWATELPTIINMTGVNLNISKWCFDTGICPRVFEVLACGGMLWTNTIKAVLDEFGDYVIPYRVEDNGSIIISPAKVKDGARDYILQKHTWDHRAKRVEEVVWP